MSLGGRRWVSIAAAVTAILVGGSAAARDEGVRDRAGIFGGFHLGGSQANFRLATNSDPSGDTGNDFGGRIGYGINDRFLLSLDLNVWNATYKTVISTIDLYFTTVALEGAYVIPVTDAGSGFFGRLGIGQTQVSSETKIGSGGFATDGATGTSLTLTGGFEWLLGEDFALGVDIFKRYTGLKFKDSDSQTDMFGLNLSFLWY